jgi:hypothetical protein
MAGCSRKSFSSRGTRPAWRRSSPMTCEWLRIKCLSLGRPTLVGLHQRQRAAFSWDSCPLEIMHFILYFRSQRVSVSQQDS